MMREPEAEAAPTSISPCNYFFFHKLELFRIEYGLGVVLGSFCPDVSKLPP